MLVLYKNFCNTNEVNGKYKGFGANHGKFNDPF